MLEKIEINYFINCLWNYLNTYLSSNIKNDNNEDQWFLILERSKLNMTNELINKLIRDPNNIFKIVKFTDNHINHIQILKLRFFIGLYWLNYLMIIKHKETIKINTSITNHLIDNWKDSIEQLINLIKNRGVSLLQEKKKKISNLEEIQKIKVHCPTLDTSHEERLKKQIKIISNMLDINVINDLSKILEVLKKIDTDEFSPLINTLNNIDYLYTNLNDFLEIYTHINNELMYNQSTIKKKIFFTKKIEFNKLLKTNLIFKDILEKYKPIIDTPSSLSWFILDEIKIIELKINDKEVKLINFLMEKTDSTCKLIYKIILKFNHMQVFSNIDKYNNYFSEIKEIINNLNDKILNYKKEIEKIEEDNNYMDILDLDLNFFNQIFTNIGILLNSINIGKYYKDNFNNNFIEEFSSNTAFDDTIDALRNKYISKDDFTRRINIIENRINKLEKNSNTNSIVNNVVISLFNIFVWKKILKLKKKSFNKFKH